MDEILLTERRQFTADHYHDLPGFCESRHAHSWELEVTACHGPLARLGLMLDVWVADVNNSLLNEQEIFKGRNPTAEVLAEKLFQYLELADICPKMVKVREKSNYWAACLK